MRILFFISIFLISIKGYSDDLALVAVGKPTAIEEKLFVNLKINGSIRDKKFLNAINEFKKLFENDFSFYIEKFIVVNKEKIEGLDEIKDIDSWKKNTDINYLINIDFELVNSKLTYNVSAVDVIKDKILHYSKGIINLYTLREVGHNISDSIYKSITDKESIFKSKIVFVSDKTRFRKNVYKELYIMDFDGRNAKRLTAHQGTVISPAISNDKSKVLYSLIKSTVSKKRNINLYLLDLKTGRSKIISSRAGINSGAIFHPDGVHIILTMSFGGNTEIYKMNIKTRKIKRITKHYAVDVDPSISKDGSKLTFLSSRSGRAMIYVLDPSKVEHKVKRVSFVGKFNATPRFSPKGAEIAFSSWVDNRSDIFKIRPDGSGLYRLTKNFGSNEDPSFSNDGEFIAFTSQKVISRKVAHQNIYIMTKYGDILGPVTTKFGNCISPRWSN